MKSFSMKALIVLLALCPLILISANAEGTQNSSQRGRIITALEVIVDDLTADDVVASEEPLSPSDEPVFGSDVDIEPATSSESDSDGSDCIAPDSPCELTIFDAEGASTQPLLSFFSTVSTAQSPKVFLVSKLRASLSQRQGSFFRKLPSSFSAS